MFKVGDKVKCIDNNCASNSLTVGGIYTIVKIVDNKRLCFSDDEIYGWYPTRFEKVEVKDTYIKLENVNVTTTKWYVKNPVINGNHITYEVAYRVSNGGTIQLSSSSYIILDDLKFNTCSKKEFDGLGAIRVELNSEYTAIVSKDKIVVGCQIFSVDIVKNLVKALEELNVSLS